MNPKRLPAGMPATMIAVFERHPLDLYGVGKLRALCKSNARAAAALQELQAEFDPKQRREWYTMIVYLHCERRAA